MVPTTGGVWVLGCYMYMFFLLGRTEYVLPFNPLLHELFFSSVLERQLKIGSYRLLTHRRGAYRNFFGHAYTIVTDMQQRVNNCIQHWILSKGLPTQ